MEEQEKTTPWGVFMGLTDSITLSVTWMTRTQVSSGLKGKISVPSV